MSVDGIFSRNMEFLRRLQRLILLWPCLLMAAGVCWAEQEAWEKEVRALTGDGAVMISDNQGKSLFTVNPQKPLVPASILKILTAAAALDYLGPSHRFSTLFRRSPKGDLYVIGRGDPYLVSEEVAVIAERLKAGGLTEVRNLYLDSDYFQEGLVLHGTNRSLNPYDAYNGALCVNFNTIFVRIGPEGRVRSAEPQTPVTDISREAALRTKLKGSVRINLAESPEKCLLYAGEIIKAFLERSGIPVRGRVARAREPSETLPMFYHHRSRQELKDVLKQMFKYSNNFIANQIFLILGAERYGPPATIEKSRRVMDEYISSMGLCCIHMEEGSGLSHRTKITADQMSRVLEQFRDYRSLLRREGDAWVKTGTLMDVKSMAGYLLSAKSGPLGFVIILNGKSFTPLTRERIFSLLKGKFMEAP